MKAIIKINERRAEELAILTPKQRVADRARLDVAHVLADVYNALHAQRLACKDKGARASLTTLMKETEWKIDAELDALNADFDAEIAKAKARKRSRKS